MKHSISGIFALLIICLSCGAFAQDIDWKKELQRVLVTNSGNQMLYSDLEVCTSSANPRALQIQWEATAPKNGFISRDQFIALVTVFRSGFHAEMVKKSNGQAKLDCKPLDAVIGQVDMKIKVVTTQGGIQLQIDIPGEKKSSQSTMTWAQLLKK